MSNIPPLPTPTMNYQTPRSLDPTAGGVVFREGSLLVTPTIVRLPPGCVKCGEAEAKVFHKKLSWHHPALVLIVLVNLLIYAVVALCVRKKGEATFGLCRMHVTKRRNRILGWAGVGVISAVSAASFFVIASRRTVDDYGILAGLLGVFGGLGSLIGMLQSASILKPKLINEFQMKLSGAGERYLQIVDATRIEVPVAMPVDPYR